MSIFGIIGFAFLIAVAFMLLIILVFVIIDCCNGIDDELVKPIIITCSIVFGVFWIGGTFLGIGLNDQDERVFVAKYEASKYTIEQSLKNEDLSGLERVQLVNQAATLNGELAERKMRFDLRHHVHYDNTIYDGIELINLGE